MRLHPVLILGVACLCGCELNQIVVAQPEDVIVAELVLRTDLQVQRAVLHRTITNGDSAAATVTGARIEVTDSKGVSIVFVPARDQDCVEAVSTGPNAPIGSCYTSDPNIRTNITPGESYTLRITLADGGVMTGATQVPAGFRLLRPAVARCSLPANDTLRLSWTSSSGSWVYAAETNLLGLRAHVPDPSKIDDPLRLFGLSASAQDTTILFPTEFGVFERFDPDLTEVLAQIQNGLPAGVVADIVIAAADRNYVNWERGGDFNPSGLIRIPSIRGAGTGEFASLVPRALQIRIASTFFPPC